MNLVNMKPQRVSVSVKLKLMKFQNQNLLVRRLQHMRPDDVLIREQCDATSHVLFCFMLKLSAVTLRTC